jgi:hypothetical protein
VPLPSHCSPHTALSFYLARCPLTACSLTHCHLTARSMTARSLFLSTDFFLVVSLPSLFHCLSLTQTHCLCLYTHCNCLSHLCLYTHCNCLSHTAPVTLSQPLSYTLPLGLSPSHRPSLSHTVLSLSHTAPVSHTLPLHRVIVAGLLMVERIRPGSEPRSRKKPQRVSKVV